MKKHILLLAVIFGFDVQAKSYTEYEFAGYQENIPVVDEFTRYEQTSLHKYYSLKENVTYIDQDNESTLDLDQCTLYEKKEIISPSPSIDHINKLNYVIRSTADFDASSIRIGDLDDEKLNIKNFNLKIKDEIIPIDLSKIWKKGTSSFLISLENVPIKDVSIEFDYETDTPQYIVFTIENAHDKASILLPVDDVYNAIKVRVLPPDEYDAFKEDKDYAGNKLTMFYSYEKETYECKSIEKIYYDTLEVESLEGYTYDPTEDKIVYKVFKREAIEEPEVTDRPEELEIPKEQEAPAEKEESCPQPDTLTINEETNKKDKIQTQTLLNTQNKEETVKEDTELLDKIAHLESTLENLIEKSEEQNDLLLTGTKQLEKTDKNLKVLKTILIVVFIYLTIIILYLTCVKSDD